MKLPVSFATGLLTRAGCPLPKTPPDRPPGVAVAVAVAVAVGVAAAADTKRGGRRLACPAR